MSLIDALAGRLSRLYDWLFRDRTTGEVVLGQPPNVPAVIANVAAVAEWLDLLPANRQQVRLVRVVAFVVWGADEALRGVNPFRRLLGLAALAAQVRTVARAS